MNMSDFFYLLLDFIIFLLPSYVSYILLESLMMKDCPREINLFHNFYCDLITIFYNWYKGLRIQ